MELNHASEDVDRIRVLNELGYLLFRDDPEQTLIYSEEALSLCEDVGDKSAKATAYKCHGLAFYMLADYKSAVRSWEAALKLAEELGDEQLEANLIGNMGSTYYMAGLSDQAIEYYLRSLRIAEAHNDSMRLATLLMNIGLIYAEQDHYLDSAKVFYHRSMEIGRAFDYEDLLGVGSANLGELYIRLEDYDTAVHYFNQSLEHFTSDIDRTTSLNGLGSIYFEKGELKRAGEYYKAALDLAVREHAQREMIRSLLGFAEIELYQKQYGASIDYYEQVLELAENLGLNYDLLIAYEGLAQAHSGKHNYRQAFENQALQLAMQDSINQMETEQRTENLLFGYQLEKKQDEIELMKQASEIDQLRDRRQRAMLISSGLFVLLLLIFAAGLINRMIFIRKTKSTIEEQHETIKDSINYAQRIQSAMLPTASQMDMIMPEYFVFLKPKDIVSGDFYWVKEVQDHLVIVGADCTGHGVPGAFMSMLGMTILNDMIGSRCYDAPSAILGSMRSKIKQLLVQEGSSDEQKDGMDLALAILNKQTREVHFAGANNPMYLVRRKNGELPADLAAHRVTENESHVLVDIKGDPQPIGIYDDERPFRTHSFYLEKGETFYLFSDGYIDQFGGNPRKKYKSGNFKKLLLSIQEQEMAAQRETLVDTIERWQGSYEQIDDISVIGVRV